MSYSSSFYEIYFGRKTNINNSAEEDFAMEKTSQRLSTSFCKDASWQPGLRSFFEYRDLGIAQATGGTFNAHVIRVRKPVQAFPKTGSHFHKLNFQMIYILKGWIRFTYKDQGEFTFGPGDCCLQPPEIIHDETDCSEDLELLELTSPAAFETSIAP